MSAGCLTPVSTGDVQRAIDAYWQLLAKLGRDHPWRAHVRYMIRDLHAVIARRANGADSHVR